LRVNNRSAKKSAAAANNSTLPSDVPASDPVLAWLDVTAGITSIIFTLPLSHIPQHIEPISGQPTFEMKALPANLQSTIARLQVSSKFTNLNAANFKRSCGL
jgi:hypothetical protein